MRMPDFIIIGAMKCATSTLHEQLALQSGIHMSDPKEPNFFSDDRQWGRGLEWYSWLFESARTSDLCGESSTHYTKLPTYPETIERMKAHLPDSVRFVYVMRHPIDRLVSQFIHQWTKREVDGDINDALDEHPELVAYSRYSMQLRPFVEAFGRQAIMPVFFERLTAEPQETLEAICRFVGYEGAARWADDLGRQNVSRERLRSSAVRDAMLKLPGMTTLRRRLVPQQVRDRIKSLWTMNERPQLSDRNVRYLKGIFDADLSVVGAWFGLNIRCDTYREVAGAMMPQWIAPPSETAA